MYKYFTFIFIFSLNIANADQQIKPLFENSREGKSRYLNVWTKFWLKKKQLNIHHDFFKDFSSNEQLCEENYIYRLRKNYKLKASDIKYGLLELRSKNLIDDIVYKQTYKFKNLPHEIKLDIKPENLKKIDVNDAQKKIIEQQLKQFSSYKKKRKCLSESFSNLFSVLTRSEKKKKNRFFKKIVKKLYRKKVISKKSGKRLLKLAKKRIQEKEFDLKKYQQTKLFLRKNISEDNLQNEQFNGFANFVSQKDKIRKSYPRQRLFENYNQFQIIYISQLVERFLIRLKRTETIGIHLIDDSDEAFEIFLINSPLEIYRFLVKYLRYEMSLLKENHLFTNTTVTYTDLIAASFEMYQIPPESIEELVKMEELWNPQVSKYKKIMMWGKLFTQAGIIFVPPPFNYLATLSLMAIESFIDKDDHVPNFEHSIFGVVQ